MQESDDHAGRLFWSGNLEAPFRGRSAPLMTRDEFDKIEVNYDAKVKTFNMSNPEHEAKYQEILDRAANGWYTIHHVERRWCPNTGAMMIFIEWFQKYSDLPPHLRSNGVTYEPNRPA